MTIHNSIFLLNFILLQPAVSFSQNCDCKKNFEWMKTTFEENDAGFENALKDKGIGAYEENNKRISDKVNSAKTLNDCQAVLYEWLNFFRSGHIAIRVKDQANLKTEDSFPDWEIIQISTEDFKKYLDEKKSSDFEGIWETGQYKIGIKKEVDGYIGFIIESGVGTWKKGEVKLKFIKDSDKIKSVFYTRDRTAVKSEIGSMTGKNLLQIGNTNLVRLYPVIEEEPKYAQYARTVSSKKPYIEQLNESTLYFRIPSFQPSEKKAIDSVISENRNEILKTKNLIIDIRNGTGGSDMSYKELLPFLYTNPVRVVGVEFLSTKLNNQRMLDFINKPEYGFDEEGKEWAKNSFEKLEHRLGEFVNLNDDIVSVEKSDTIYPYPENVGIIINKQNGSTDEQFLLAAKQSKKVKLFGTTTTGVLDVSNMYFIPSPCNEFELGYSLSRSMRIPDFTIDGKGIQPDYFLDKNIPQYEWTGFVSQVLNEK